MGKSTVRSVALGSLICLLAGCFSGGRVEVIDLNRVLDVLVKILEQPGKSGKTSSQVSARVKQDPVAQKQFLTLYAKELNDARLIGAHLGVELTVERSIVGFTDRNKNMKREARDKKIFKTEIDQARRRLIASDEQYPGYHRDHRYQHGGFFHGMMLGSMLSRQSTYYVGARASARPKFRGMKMSSRNYHSKAVSNARSGARSGAARSARSRGGSRGFFGGK